MFDEFERTFRLGAAEIAVLSRDPRFQDRARVLGVICGAFVAAPAVYLAVASAGVIRGAAGAPRLWPVLALLAVLHIPAMLYAARTILAQVAGVRNLEQAAMGATQLMVVTLAFGEAAAIYGFISPFLGATRHEAFAFMLAGIVFLGVILKMMWPRAVRIMLVGLAREKAGHGSR
jgi:hypothetical protein